MDRPPLSFKDALVATLICNGAQIDALRVLVYELCRHVGLDEVGGILVVEWLNEACDRNTETLLLLYELDDPGGAARMSEAIDDWRRGPIIPPGES